MENLCPKIAEYFKKRQLTTQLFTIEWMFTLFSKVFNIKVVRVIWDLFFVFGSFSIIKIGVSLFKILESEILLRGVQDGFNFIKKKTENLGVSKVVKLALQGDFLDEDEFQKRATMVILGKEADISFY